MNIRRIEPADNAEVAHIIRTVMTEFGAVGKGFSIEDPEVDAMYEAYDDDHSAYYVIENEQQEVIGCGGIAPLKGGNADTCELKKMYYLQEGRGKGVGSLLMQRLLEDAREIGFKIMYLETLERMEKANVLYRKFGFEALNGAMGNTGHTSCGLFYAKDL